MAAHKFLKKRGNRIRISVIILVFLIALYFYFAVKEKEFTVNLLNRFFAPDVSNQLIIIVPILAGLIVIPFLINFLTTDLGSKLDEKPEEKETIPTPIPLNITVKTETPPVETKQIEITPDSNQKFYPSPFIPDLKFFVGRKKLLKDLEKKLKTKHRASIHDISGLGKSFTTYKYAEEKQNDYEKIFFVRANKEEMMQSLAEIGILLNPSLKDVPDQTQQASGFKNWLEENEKWLVIYDNVDKPDELNPYVPQNKKGDCLFSSNFHLIERLAESVNIEKLDEPDAESLLFSRANNKPHTKPQFSNAKEQEAFENIVEEIDGHPLSLNTSGAIISEQNISFAEYERKLQRAPDILLENEDGFDKYHRKSTLKAFSIAIEDISGKKANDKFKNSADLAKKLLFAASFIAPDNIYEDFLQKILQALTKVDFESEENEDLWLEIRRKLLAYDLLKYDKNAKIFTTHRLIQKVIQIKQTDDEKTVTCSKVLNTIDELFPYSKFENWKQCNKFLQHSITAVEFAEKIKINSETLANNYYKIARYLNDIAQYQQAEDYLNKAIPVCRELFGEESIMVANFYNFLGKCYWYQAKHQQSIDIQLKAIKIREKISGENNQNTATCYCDLAAVYKDQSKYKEAEDYYKKAIKIYEKELGTEHIWTAISYNQLAQVYDSQERYDEAIQLYKQSIEIAQKTVGEEHPYYATRLNNLALVYKSQGKFEEAIELFKQAIKIDEITIGIEHPDYAKHLSNLAQVYLLQGRYEEAIELCKQAIEIDEKTIGKEHPSYAIHLNDLAIIYERQGKYSEALLLFNESLGIFENTLPENHPHTQTVKGNLELCLKAAGKG
jgi:tetratricopeptide (TPR) repeat protein